MAEPTGKMTIQATATVAVTTKAEKRRAAEAAAAEGEASGTLAPPEQEG